MQFYNKHLTQLKKGVFHKTGTWNFDKWYPSVETLKHVFQVHGQDKNGIETLSQLFNTFEKNQEHY